MRGRVGCSLSTFNSEPLPSPDFHKHSKQCIKCVPSVDTSILTHWYFFASLSLCLTRDPPTSSTFANINSPAGASAASQLTPRATASASSSKSSISPPAPFPKSVSAPHNPCPPQFFFLFPNPPVPFSSPNLRALRVSVAKPFQVNTYAKTPGGRSPLQSSAALRYAPVFRGNPPSVLSIFQSFAHSCTVFFGIFSTSPQAMRPIFFTLRTLVPKTPGGGGSNHLTNSWSQNGTRPCSADFCVSVPSPARLPPARAGRRPPLQRNGDTQAEAYATRRRRRGLGLRRGRGRGHGGVRGPGGTTRGLSTCSR